MHTEKARRSAVWFPRFHFFFFFISPVPLSLSLSFSPWFGLRSCMRCAFFPELYTSKNGRRTHGGKEGTKRPFLLSSSSGVCSVGPKTSRRPIRRKTWHEPKKGEPETAANSAGKRRRLEKKKTGLMKKKGERVREKKAEGGKEKQV